MQETRHRYCLPNIARAIMKPAQSRQESGPDKQFHIQSSTQGEIAGLGRAAALAAGLNGAEIRLQLSAPVCVCVLMSSTNRYYVLHDLKHVTPLC